MATGEGTGIDVAGMDAAGAGAGTAAGAAGAAIGAGPAMALAYGGTISFIILGTIGAAVAVLGFTTYLLSFLLFLFLPVTQIIP